MALLVLPPEACCLYCYITLFLASLSSRQRNVSQMNKNHFSRKMKDFPYLRSSMMGSLALSFCVLPPMLLHSFQSAFVTLVDCKFFHSPGYSSPSRILHPFLFILHIALSFSLFIFLCFFSLPNYVMLGLDF